MIGIRHSLLSYSLIVGSILLFHFANGKGFGGSRGGGFGKSGSKGPGSFGGPASYSRPSSYGTNMGKVRSGSGFKSAAMSFAAGAAGGVAAYSLMRAMSGSHYRPGYYEPGYGGGDTCFNNEDINGTVFGRFRCPLNGFPFEARYCCGDYGKQFCCIREGSGRSFVGSSYFFWVVIIVILLIIIVLIWARHQRRQREEVIMVPTEVPVNEMKGPPFYQPPPPPMGYPSPPQGNPYAQPPQYPPNNFGAYPQQGPYPMAYPPQQPPYNPYQGPPNY